MKTLEEKQQMIAEFVGHESSHFPKHYHLHKINLPLTKLEDLKFNSSWDWLMPVAKECQRLLSVRNANEFYMLQSLEESILSFKPERAFEEIVEVIEWYNENIAIKK